MLNKPAVPQDSHQDAALPYLLEVEGESTRHMQTVSAAHSNCVSTCYAARIWAKCAGRRMQLISSKHRTACSLIHSSLSHCLHINLRHVPSQLIFFSGRPEPYSAQWAYLPAINRSAGALSPTGREVIMRTILTFTPKPTMNEINRVYSMKDRYYTTVYSHLIQGFSCW